MVLAAAQLQSLGTDAAALRRKRAEEQCEDMNALPPNPSAPKLVLWGRV